MMLYAQGQTSQAVAQALGVNSHDVPTRLTSRELQIMQQYAQGFSSQEVAASLGISIGTMKVHESNVRQKCGVHNRMQALCRLVQQGVISLPALTAVDKKGGKS